MSWSTQAVGKPLAVAARVQKNLSNLKCSEPEEAIKTAAGALIAMALGSMPEGSAVKVVASGSQYSPNSDGKYVNSLKIEIEPIYGFVE